jgi:hypothetical protein
MAHLAYTLSVLILTGFLLNQPVFADNAPAAPQAVAAYRAGMSQLSLPNPDFAEAQRLFAKAAALKLPHADYGLACVIYRLRERERFQEAFTLAKRAADHNVYEARAALVGYYIYGIGTPRDYKASDAILHELNALDLSHGLKSGAPGTLEIKDPKLARRLIEHALTSGECSPPIVLTPQQARDAIIFRRKFVGPDKDGHFPPEAEPPETD